MHGSDINSKIDLNTERMKGWGEALAGEFRVNLLHGLNDMCKEYVKPTDIVLELGTNMGVSTKLFSLYAKEVVTVDMVRFPEIDKLIKETSNIKFIKSTFINYFNTCEMKFDLIYIDGRHHYKNVVGDIKDSLKHIKTGGIISGHDMSSITPDVKKAVLSFFPEKEIKIFSDSSWLVKL